MTYTSRGLCGTPIAGGSTDGSGVYAEGPDGWGTVIAVAK
jgi:hypothetical protein